MGLPRTLSPGGMGPRFCPISRSIGLINAEQIAGDKVSNAQSKLWTMNCTKRGERSLFTSGARTLTLARGTEANDSSTSSAP